MDASNDGDDVEARTAIGWAVYDVEARAASGPGIHDVEVLHSLLFYMVIHSLL